MSSDPTRRSHMSISRPISQASAFENPHLRPNLCSEVSLAARPEGEAPGTTLDPRMRGPCQSRGRDPHPTPILYGQPPCPWAALTCGATGKPPTGWVRRVGLVSSSLGTPRATPRGGRPSPGHTHLSSPEDISSLNSELSLLPGKGTQISERGGLAGAGPPEQPLLRWAQAPSCTDVPEGHCLSLGVSV